MLYLFILGRNPELSVAELKSFFKKEKYEYSEFKVRGNSVLIDFDRNLDAGVVELLGGTIAIGRVLCDTKNIDKTEIYFSEKNNFSYVLWDFSDESENISEYLKKRFKKEKLKASEKKLRLEMDLQDSEKAQNLSSKLVQEQYFVFENYFGKIIEYYDYEKVEKRDMQKPVRRESLSISPRLAKIMINLSGVKENEILLDCFCGVGVVLSEALNQNIKVVGVDKDKDAIKGALENLKWFGFSEENYKLLNEDSSRVNLSKFKISGMASEPDFGETLKKIPDEKKAEEMIKRFENLMTKILINIRKYVDGKIVFTSPYIRIGKKRLGADLEILAEKVDMKISDGFPIPEFRENHIVGRQIVVLESQ